VVDVIAAYLTHMAAFLFDFLVCALIVAGREKT
jgi:hypothetical protein